MRKRLLSIFIVLCLILSMVPAAFAADETGALAIYDDTNTLVQYVNTFDEANEVIKEYEQFRNYTIVLQDDVSTELKTQNYGTVACGIDLLCNLDLNGHTLTISGNVTGTILMVSGINVSNKGTVISNGTIMLTFTAPNPTTQSGVTYPLITTGILLSSDACAIKNVSVLTQETETVIDGIVYGDGAPSDTSEETAPNSIDNVSINVTGNAFKFQEAIKNDTKIVINSGSFCGLDLTLLPTSLTINAESNSIADLTGVNDRITVITSDATTALIVDDGNAYLYDTLQDAVNAASRRLDDDGKVTIQLLKQPESDPVVLPEEVSAENITLTVLETGESTSIDYEEITMTDSSGNTVTVNEEGGLEIAVSSITLSQTTAALYSNHTPSTVTLTATVSPEDATDTTVTWSTSNDKIAAVMVNADGSVTVTAVGNGAATITATAGDASAECVVTVSTYVPPVPSYLITLPDLDNGTVTSDRATARQGATVTLTVTPEDGYTLDEISVTDFFGNAVEVVPNADGTYSFVMPYSQVEVSATFARTEEPIVFTDVPEGAYYYDPVYWAVANGITDGTSDTEFSPGRTVTRGEMVTFLWRAAGSPEPETTVNPFTDVDAEEYYYEAVLWAAANGVTDGMTATTFEPAGSCTRAQAVTFLYRDRA